MIRSIFTDIGQVLVRVDFHRLVASLANDSEKSGAEIAAYLSDSRLVSDYRDGKVGTDAFLAGLKSEIGYSASENRLALTWNDIFEPVEENILLMSGLRERYNVVLISNTNPLHVQKIFSMIEDINFFDRIVLSYEVGVSKPDPAIFQYALEVSNAVATESIFIDDMEENVAQARRLGFIAGRLRRPADLKSLLTELGVAI